MTAIYSIAVDSNMMNTTTTTYSKCQYLQQVDTRLLSHKRISDASPCQQSTNTVVAASRLHATMKKLGASVCLKDTLASWTEMPTSNLTSFNKDFIMYGSGWIGTTVLGNIRTNWYSILMPTEPNV